MRHAQHTLLLAIIVGGLALGCARQETFTSAEGGFAISLPAKPSDQHIQPTPVAGRNIDAHTFVWVTPRAEYMVMYMETPKVLEDPAISKKILDDARENALKEAGGKLLGERDLSLGGHVGREFKVGSSKGTFVDRVYLVGQRFYMVSALVASADPGEEDAASKTLDSFKFTAKNGDAVK